MAVGEFGRNCPLGPGQKVGVGESDIIRQTDALATARRIGLLHLMRTLTALKIEAAVLLAAWGINAALAVVYAAQIIAASG